VTQNPVADAVIRRDRTIILAGLAAIILAAAIYTVRMAQTYGGMPATILHQHDHAGQGSDSFLILFTMWAVMMVAMMSPTAVPMVLMHTKVERHRHPEQTPFVPTTIFFMGYILVWAAFSAVLALGQMLLQSTALLSPGMASASPWLAGGILIAAGLFQFSKLKEACLSQCRSPVTYFMLEWREGNTGALRMGLKHGVHCVGCCWVLMALLFVAGVMNLLWMALITVFVLIEKVMPRGELFGRVGGVGMVIWGIGIIVMGMVK
jgi:predicted metal-binding membrane protein